MKNVVMKYSAAAAIAGAMVISLATASWAALVLSNTAALMAATPTAVTDVRYRSARPQSREWGRAGDFQSGWNISY
jgi:hypothetical protein